MAREQAGPLDPRYQINFEAEGVQGFFVKGAHAAIQWEQVTRMMQLRVLQMARNCAGPTAFHNLPDGRPDSSTVPSSRQRGQMVYYLQAVDRFKHVQPRE